MLEHVLSRLTCLEVAQSQLTYLEGGLLSLNARGVHGLLESTPELRVARAIPLGLLGL